MTVKKAKTTKKTVKKTRPKKEKEPKFFEFNYDTQKEEPIDSPVGGRPSAMTKDVVQKLEAAFAWGYNDDEAAIYAGVARTTVHNYATKYPSFLDKKDELKKRVNMHAKSNITKLIKLGDKEMSRWWLERRCKKEFSLRTEHTGKDGVSLAQIAVVTEKEFEEAAKRLEEQSS